MQNTEDSAGVLTVLRVGFKNTHEKQRFSLTFSMLLSPITTIFPFSNSQWNINIRNEWPTRWTWVWASFGSCWWTGRPGVLQSPRVGHDWATELMFRLPILSFFFNVFYVLLFFNWRIITPQYCDGFCHTSTRINQRYTCVPSLLSAPLHLSPPPYLSPQPPVPLAITEHWIELPVSYIKFPLAIYFTYGNIHASMLVPQSSYPEETITEKDTWTPTFTAALFKIVRMWKQPRCPSQMNG